MLIRAWPIAFCTTTTEPKMTKMRSTATTTTAAATTATAAATTRSHPGSLCEI